MLRLISSLKNLKRNEIPVKLTIIDLTNLASFFTSNSIEQNSVEFIWLGQAGFAFRFSGTTFIIDPYLSDYLSKKYQGTLFPHTRLMDIPIKPEEIDSPNYVICSHPHSDHMDPDTVSILSQLNPECKFILPSAAKDEAILRGISEKQIIKANSESPIVIDAKTTIIPLPAAHEVFQINDQGEHMFLGFVFKFGNLVVYHSGDCIPYPGLAALLQKYHVQVAFLPINGRDEYRLQHNIAGNFHFKEVVDLCEAAKIPNLIVHHFGMFAYNTVSNLELQNIQAASSEKLTILIPQIHKLYALSITEKVFLHF